MVKPTDLKHLVHYLVDAPPSPGTVRLVCAVCHVAATSHDYPHALTTMSLHWNKMIREHEPEHQEVTP